MVATNLIGLSKRRNSQSHVAMRYLAAIDKNSNNESFRDDNNHENNKLRPMILSQHSNRSSYAVSSRTSKTSVTGTSSSILDQSTGSVSLEGSWTMDALNSSQDVTTPRSVRKHQQSACFGARCFSQTVSPSPDFADKVNSSSLQRDMNQTQTTIKLRSIPVGMALSLHSKSATAKDSASSKEIFASDVRYVSSNSSSLSSQRTYESPSSVVNQVSSNDSIILQCSNPKQRLVRNGTPERGESLSSEEQYNTMSGTRIRKQTTNFLNKSFDMAVEEGLDLLLDKASWATCAPSPISVDCSTTHRKGCKRPRTSSLRTKSDASACSSGSTSPTTTPLTTPSSASSRDHRNFSSKLADSLSSSSLVTDAATEIATNRAIDIAMKRIREIERKGRSELAVKEARDSLQRKNLTVHQSIDSVSSRQGKKYFNETCSSSKVGMQVRSLLSLSSNESSRKDVLECTTVGDIEEPLNSGRLVELLRRSDFSVQADCGSLLSRSIPSSEIVECTAAMIRDKPSDTIKDQTKTNLRYAIPVVQSRTVMDLCLPEAGWNEIDQRKSVQMVGEVGCKIQTEESPTHELLIPVLLGTQPSDPPGKGPFVTKTCRAITPTLNIALGSELSTGIPCFSPPKIVRHTQSFEEQSPDPIFCTRSLSFLSSSAGLLYSSSQPESSISNTFVSDDAVLMFQSPVVSVSPMSLQSRASPLVFRPRTKKVTSMPHGFSRPNRIPTETIGGDSRRNAFGIEMGLNDETSYMGCIVNNCSATLEKNLVHPTVRQPPSTLSSFLDDSTLPLPLSALLPKTAKENNSLLEESNDARCETFDFPPEEVLLVRECRSQTSRKQMPTNYTSVKKTKIASLEPFKLTPLASCLQSKVDRTLCNSAGSFGNASHQDLPLVDTTRPSSRISPFSTKSTAIATECNKNIYPFQSQSIQQHGLSKLTHSFEGVEGRRRFEVAQNFFTAFSRSSDIGKKNAEFYKNVVDDEAGPNLITNRYERTSLGAHLSRDVEKSTKGEDVTKHVDIQSIRSAFESIQTSPDEECDDDCSSVKSLREIFEPAPPKPDSNRSIANIRAIFESKKYPTIKRMQSKDGLFREKLAKFEMQSEQKPQHGRDKGQTARTRSVRHVCVRPESSRNVGRTFSQSNCHSEFFGLKSTSDAVHPKKCFENRSSNLDDDDGSKEFDELKSRANPEKLAADTTASLSTSPVRHTIARQTIELIPSMEERHTSAKNAKEGSVKGSKNKAAGLLGIIESKTGVLARVSPRSCIRSPDLVCQSKEAPNFLHGDIQKFGYLKEEDDHFSSHALDKHSSDLSLDNAITKDFDNLTKSSFIPIKLTPDSSKPDDLHLGDPKDKDSNHHGEHIVTHNTNATTQKNISALRPPVTNQGKGLYPIPRHEHVITNCSKHVNAMNVIFNDCDSEDSSPGVQSKNSISCQNNSILKVVSDNDEDSAVNFGRIVPVVVKPVARKLCLGDSTAKPMQINPALKTFSFSPFKSVIPSGEAILDGERMTHDAGLVNRTAMDQLKKSTFASHHYAGHNHKLSSAGTGYPLPKDLQIGSHAKQPEQSDSVSKTRTSSFLPPGNFKTSADITMPSALEPATFEAKNYSKGARGHEISFEPRNAYHNDPNNGAESESEFSDGVTLDVSIAEVSNLTFPTALLSKACDRSVSTNGDDYFSDPRSTDMNESAAKRSEASSSQTSEAAHPLLAKAIRLLPKSDEYSAESFFQTRSLNTRNWETTSAVKSLKNDNEFTTGAVFDVKGKTGLEDAFSGWNMERIESSFPVVDGSKEKVANTLDWNPFAADMSLPASELPASDEFGMPFYFNGLFEKSLDKSVYPNHEAQSAQEEMILPLIPLKETTAYSSERTWQTWAQLVQNAASEKGYEAPPILPSIQKPLSHENVRAAYHGSKHTMLMARLSRLKESRINRADALQNCLPHCSPTDPIDCTNIHEHVDSDESDSTDGSTGFGGRCFLASLDVD